MLKATCKSLSIKIWALKLKCIDYLIDSKVPSHSPKLN